MGEKAPQYQKWAEQVETVWQHTPHSARPLVLWPLISALIYRFDIFCGLLPFKSILMCLSKPVGPQASCVSVIGSWMASRFTSPIKSGPTGATGLTICSHKGQSPARFSLLSSKQQLSPYFQMMFLYKLLYTCVLAYLWNVTNKVFSKAEFPSTALQVHFKCTDVYLLHPLSWVCIRRVDC